MYNRMARGKAHEKPHKINIIMMIKGKIYPIQVRYDLQMVDIIKKRKDYTDMRSCQPVFFNKYNT